MPSPGGGASASSKARRSSGDGRPGVSWQPSHVRQSVQARRYCPHRTQASVAQVAWSIYRSPPPMRTWPSGSTRISVSQPFVRMSVADP